MRIKELAELLIDYGRANSVTSLIAATPYLEALTQAFGDREVRDVSAKDLYAFHKEIRALSAMEPLLRAVEKKSQRWEHIYACRAQGLIEWLQWESDHPVRALVDL